MLAQAISVMRVGGDLEATAGSLMRLVEATAQRALDAIDAEVLRVVLHVRPNGALGPTLVLERDRVRTRFDRTSFELSTTAWSYLHKSRAAVLLEVDRGIVRLLANLEETHRVWPMAAPRAELAGSQRVMLDRTTTHALYVPLVTPSGVEGSLAIEVTTQFSIGQRLEALELLARELNPVGPGVGPWIVAAATHHEGTSVGPTSNFPVVGNAMIPVLRSIQQIGPYNETVLVRGETGVGKTYVARELHKQWCNADPTTRGAARLHDARLHEGGVELMAGELFGWVKGAFTGAITDRDGRLAQAEGGTLFIDEIHQLDLGGQAKLLRMLDDGTYSRLEERDVPRRANVRFVFATNRDLEAEVAEGRFLPDLYYRIAVLPVDVPPLREQVDVVGEWARWMAIRWCEANLPRRPSKVTITDAWIADLEERRWPGNLRQLHNVVTGACIQAAVGWPGGDIVIPGKEAASSAAGTTGSALVLRRMESTAAAFVAEARRRADQGRVLQPGLAKCLEGFVIQRAVHDANRRGQRSADALRILGMGNAVDNRNTVAKLKKADDEVSKFREAWQDP